MPGSTLPTSDLQGTYSVFTGTDIYTVFSDSIISTMQGISYSITRQKAPIYTMGSPDPRAIARSKRGIAGSMILTTFDRHALADFMRASQFAAKKLSIETTPTNPYNKTYEIGGESPAVISKAIQSLSPRDAATALQSAANVAASDAGLTSASTSMSESVAPMFTDQLMPFDTTLMGSNEYGVGSVMRVFGLEILNEGSGVSIDDTSNEVQMTYISRLISPWVQQTRLT